MQKLNIWGSKRSQLLAGRIDALLPQSAPQVETLKIKGVPFGSMDK